MKKLLFILLAIIISGQEFTFAQEIEADSLQTTLSEKEILTLVASNTRSEENYKLYSTENMWNFIKLDTRTGRLWQVQYSTQGYEYRFQSVLSDLDLSYDENTKPNRFELYPTKNTYNFILLDKVDGRVWQVQWSFEEEERMVLRIY